MTFSKDLKASAITVAILTSTALVATMLGAMRVQQHGGVGSLKIPSFQSVSAHSRYLAYKTSLFVHRWLDNSQRKDEFRDRMLRIQSKRQQTLADGCQELERQRREGLYHHSGYRRSFMFNVPSPLWLTYCAIPKCSTTTWFNFFQRATGRRCRQGWDEFTCAWKKFRGPSSTGKFFPSSLVVVRDPWRRLVSAYEDKFVTQRYGLAKKCYRQHNKSIEGQVPVTFAEFVHCILEDNRDGRQLDIHYAPQHWQCWLCKANYSYIAKLETLSDDFRYLSEFAFPEHNYTAYHAIFSTGRRRTNELRNLTSVTYEDSYRSLRPEDAAALVHLYRHDAELFGYPLQPLA